MNLIARPAQPTFPIQNRPHAGRTAKQAALDALERGVAFEENASDLTFDDDLPGDGAFEAVVRRQTSKSRRA